MAEPLKEEFLEINGTFLQQLFPTLDPSPCWRQSRSKSEASHGMIITMVCLKKVNLTAVDALINKSK
jgi:hypothetical protein